MTATPFTNWTTAQLTARMQEVANRCVEVANMPDEVADAKRSKGNVSLRQSGAFSAVVVLQLARELEARGVSTGVGDLV